MYPIDTLWAMGRERDRERMEAADRRREAAAIAADSVPETGESSSLIARLRSLKRIAVTSDDPCSTC